MTSDEFVDTDAKAYTVGYCPSEESQLEEYFRLVSEAPVLTREQELQLAYRVEEGDSEARDLLIHANQPLVVGMARRQADGKLVLLRLLQEGTLGLLRAVEAYDPSTGARFTEVANHWIEDAIHRALSSENHDHPRE